MIDLSINDISMNDISMNDISQNNIIYNKDSSINKYKLINITIFLLIIEFVLLFRVNTRLDRMILYLAIYGQFLLFFSLNFKNPFLIEISHIIFGITILLVLFFSTDILMNLFCYNVILITIISRWYFGGCLMLKCNEVNISLIPNMEYSIFYSSGFLLIIMKLLYLI